MWLHITDTKLTGRAKDTSIFKVITIMSPKSIMWTFKQTGFRPSTSKIVQIDVTSALPKPSKTVCYYSISAIAQLTTCYLSIIGIPSIITHCTPFSVTSSTNFYTPFIGNCPTYQSNPLVYDDKYFSELKCIY